MAGRFVLKRSGKGFHCNLHSKNGQVIATSEHYESRRAAMKGIVAVRKKARDAKFAEADDQPANKPTAKKPSKKVAVKRSAKKA